jgi:hypothetical protein
VIDFKDFFAASVGAAAALIGLLFVAVSLRLEKIFGAGAIQTMRGSAVAAFIALGNVFFVSLAALMPRLAPQAIVAIALISILQILKASATMSRLYPSLRGWRRFGLISTVIYVLELVIALRLTLNVGHPEGVVYTVLGLYGYALGVSWDLLGAPETIEK